MGAGLILGAAATTCPKRLAAAGYLNGQSFGFKADAGADGSGTDNAPAFQAFLDQMLQGGYREGVIPPGRYALGQTLSMHSEDIQNVILHAEAVELIFTLPSAQERRAYLSIINPAAQAELLRLEGLSVRLNRPASRVAHSDMIRLYGFHRYDIDQVNIPSADNMGLTIGRGGPKVGRPTPRSISIRGCRIGGHREALEHSHGSIGDTGIWIISPAEETHISDCVIRETGDDGLFVGHAASKAIRKVTIKNNIFRDNGARAIGIAVPNVDVLENDIDRTNGPGIICEWQNGGDASSSFIARNKIHRAGQLEPGDIGSSLMAKRNSQGIMIHQPGGSIRIEDNEISAVRGDGISVFSHREGPFDGLTIQGGIFREIGVDRAGIPRPSTDRVAVFSRAGSYPSSVSGVQIANCKVDQSSALLLRWQSTAISDDGPVSVRGLQLSNVTIPSEGLVQIGSRLAGRPERVVVDVAFDPPLNARAMAALSRSSARLTVRVSP
jgi:hypothetical protein